MSFKKYNDSSLELNINKADFDKLFTIDEQ